MRTIFLITLICVSFVFADLSRANSVVTDSKSNLMWQDDSAVVSTKHVWSDAITYCEALNLGGYSDWRVPNINELLSIVDDTTVSPFFNAIFEYTKEYYYWSSTTDSTTATQARYVNFASASSVVTTKTNEISVRCVRGN